MFKCCVSDFLGQAGISNTFLANSPDQKCSLFRVFARFFALLLKKFKFLQNATFFIQRKKYINPTIQITKQSSGITTPVNPLPKQAIKRTTMKQSQLYYQSGNKAAGPTKTPPTRLSLPLLPEPSSTYTTSSHTQHRKAISSSST